MTRAPKVHVCVCVRDTKRVRVVMFVCVVFVLSGQRQRFRVVEKALLRERR